MSEAGHPRRVRVHPAVEAKARHAFPPSGSPDGRPSCELFSKRALEPVIEAWQRNFEASPEAEPGSPIRVLLTFPNPEFPPLAFYGILVGDEVEIWDFTVDEEYWDTDQGQ